MTRLVFATPAEAYQGVIGDVLTTGHPRGDTREIIGYDFTIRRPDQLTNLYRPGARKLNPAIGAVEALQLLGQVSLPEVHTDLVGVFSNWLDYGIFEGAYGQRIHGQLAKVVQTLSTPGSRQAVMTIYDGHRDLLSGSRDVPCTLALQFFIRDDRLVLRTTMRSNDAWLGLPYDLTQFITLQAAVAAALGLSVGEYHHSVGSMHLYERHVGKAMKVANEEDSGSRLIPSPSRDSLLVKFPMQSIGDLSSWARRALVDPTHPEPAETRYQVWLRQSVIRRSVR